MAVIKVLLTDTIVTFVNKVNDVSAGLGDVALLDTSGPDSDAVSSINSLDSDMGRQANLNYKDSADSAGDPAPKFLTIVDAINRIVDSDGKLQLELDSDLVQTHNLADLAVDSDKIDSGAVQGFHIADNIIDSNHLADNIIDSNHLVDSAIYAAKFDAMTVLKIFASDSSELRKIYGPARFDTDSADTFKTNPWV